MKIYKRLIAILMSVLMLITYMPASVFAEEGEDIASGVCGTCEWVIDANGVLTISGGTMDDWDWLPPWRAYCDRIKEIKAAGIVDLKTCNRMFCDCVGLTSLDLSGFDTSNVSDMESMFHGCSSLTSIDFSNIDTSRVSDMSYMFDGCKSLTSLDLRSFDTSNVSDMFSMFDGCSSLTSLDLRSFDTSNVSDMYSMFNDCSSLTSLDISSFDTSKVERMEKLFMWCSSLTSLDLSNFNTSSCTNMDGMFQSCRSLTNLDLSSFNTSSCTTMEDMFSNCDSLIELDLRSFDTSIVRNMSTMFSNCSSLTSIDVSSFDTREVYNMSHMFEDCESLTNLDLSNFDTSNVHEMYFMFDGCHSLSSLDLSNFDTSNVKSMWQMFNECYYLHELKVGKWVMDSIEYSDDVATFPVEMKDASTGEIFASGSVIPELSNRTYIAVDPYEQDMVKRRYIIGKDTWRFPNYGVKKVELRDYSELYNPAYSLLLWKNHPSFTNGLCYGYSLLIPSILEKKVPFPKSDKEINGYEFEEVRKHLIQAMICQYDPAVIIAGELNRGDLTKLCEKVRNEVYNQGEPVIINVWGGGHEVLATSIIKDTPEEVIIGVYDPNFPDNTYPYKDETGLYDSDIYTSVRLYGNDGKYRRCEWGISHEEGGEFLEDDRTGDITESVSFCSDINLLSLRLSGLLQKTNDNEGVFSLISKPTNVKLNKNAVKVVTIGGEADETDCLYWAEATDGEYCFTNVCANDEIQVAVENKIISVIPDEDSEITLKLSNEAKKAELQISSNDRIGANCKYLETQLNDRFIQTELSLEGKNNISIKINNDEVVSNGVEGLKVEQTSGYIDGDNAELIGETIFNGSYDQINENNDYFVNITAENAPCSNGHTFGIWKVTKKATEVATGFEVRTCSVCGETETQKIAQLAPTLPAVKISKVVKGKKSAIVKWKKLSKKNQKKIAKIQIQYSTDKKFKKGVKTVYAKKSAASKKISKLKSKKTYYVRIRAYKKSGGKVHVSKWSARKSVKVK